MNIEEFREIKSLPNGYFINKKGVVISTKRGSPHILKQKLGYYGYKSLVLYVDKKHKTFFVHKLVAECFCDNPLNEKIVNHKDGNKLNNYYTNLEWVNKSQDCLHAIRVLGKKVVCNNAAKRKPITNGINSFVSITDAALQTKILKTSIANCLARRAKTAGGHQWNYL